MSLFVNLLSIYFNSQYAILIYLIFLSDIEFIVDSLLFEISRYSNLGKYDKFS